MHKRILTYLTIILLTFVVASVYNPLTAFHGFAQGTCRTFTETGKQVCGRFLEYWQQNGGLAQQGLPLSNEFQEVSDLNGQTYTVQYFERAVFEKHPENARPFDVLLSQLGTFQFQRKYPGGDPSGSAPPQPTQAAPAPTQPAPPQSTGEQTVSGQSTKVSDPVTLKKGLAVFRMVHTNGDRNFIVHLVDMTGKDIEFLANEIGPVDMSAAGEVPADGQYLIEVDADGSWTVTITQPRGTYSPPPATQTFSGKGPTVTQLFSLKAGAARFQMEHKNGDSNFIVHLIDANTGRTVDFLANEIGPANLSTIENIRANGVFVLEIDADGDWNVTIQQ